MSKNYLEINRANWDERAPAHAASRAYGFEHFARDPAYVSETVRFDLPRLGQIAGLRGVHLQCHIGTDTVSLARLGARMSGLDFSPASLAEARRLCELADADVDFHEADVYRALEVLEPRAFDLVYTGIGALCWLPSISRWADVVVGLLRPGGRLFLREGHPVLWTLQLGRNDDLLVIEDPYFEREEGIPCDDGGTYVETSQTFQQNATLQWNHGLGEIVTALLARGMRIVALEEHDSVPWEALPGMMEPAPLEEFRLRDRPYRLPHSYTLQAIKA